MTDTSGSADHSSIICHKSTFSGQKNKTASSSFIFLSKATFMDSVVIMDCNFANNQFTILSANTEKDDRGIYNIEKIRVMNNRIAKQDGMVLDLYRGGTDESTLGPDLVLANNVLMDCSSDQPLLKLTGIQKTNIRSNQFLHSNRNRQLIYFKDRVRAKHIVKDNVLQNSGSIEANEYVKQVGNLNK
jgi:poly(beta-D-mannuronate) lyase